MDWKETRAAIPRAGLSILSRERVVSAGHINLMGDQPARHVACELISRYEQRLHLQGFDHFELKKIKFHSGTGRLSKTIPLAPVPQESGTLKDSGEVCSMGVLIKKGLLGQVWFILRVRYAGNVLHFNLEASERDNAGGFAMNVTANALLLPLNLIGGGQSEPTVAFGKQSEKRLEWARTQASPISEALTEAVESIEDEMEELKSQAAAVRAQQRSQANPVDTSPPRPAPQQSPVTPPPIAPTSEKKKRW